MEIETYLINLDGADVRLASAQSQLEAINWPFKRFPAVNGRNLTAQQQALYSEKHAFRAYGRSLSPGEIGCFLSHYEILQKFLSGSADYCLALEDDLRIEADFPELLQALLSYLQTSGSQGWYVVNLGNNPKKCHTELTRLSTSRAEHMLVAAHHFPVLTTGLLWSREGAEAFIKSCVPIVAPVDQYLKDWCTRDGKGRGLAFLDPPVKTTEAESQIAFSSDLKEARRGVRNVLYFFRKQRRHTLNNVKAHTAKKAFDKKHRL